MDKQELIKHYNFLIKSKPFNEIYKKFIEELEELDKPKIKVMQFVANWYEENKDKFEVNLWYWITCKTFDKTDGQEEFYCWLNDSNNKPLQTLVNMHQFGYEIEEKAEEEKRYRVTLKPFMCSTEELVYIYDTGKWAFLSYEDAKYEKITHTRQELEKAGFGWVFDCEGIEIEEVHARRMTEEYFDSF